MGPSVDYCDQDKDKTLMANAFVPLILAEVALRNNIKLVYISSGCIFNYDYAKDKPIDEEKSLIISIFFTVEPRFILNSR
ncbi:MAG: sugar nucleotide-binding protein [Candidatus Omnitrophota bacterium]|nr:sugar nucleotide-binding protein [Candidatus Omnitrophota bacterium]